MARYTGQGVTLLLEATRIVVTRGSLHALKYIACRVGALGDAGCEAMISVVNSVMSAVDQHCLATMDRAGGGWCLSCSCPSVRGILVDIIPTHPGIMSPRHYVWTGWGVGGDALHLARLDFSSEIAYTYVMSPPSPLQLVIDKLGEVPEELRLLLKLAGIELVAYSYCGFAAIFCHQGRGMRWAIPVGENLAEAARTMLDELAAKNNPLIK